MDSANVLIVEDERIVALDIKAQLSSMGHTVCGIYSRAEDALSFVEQSHNGTNALPVDIALMDVTLAGEMDGIEAAGILRDRFSLPVIVLTAYTDERTIERAKAIGPYAYIAKPFDRRELSTSIILAVNRSRIDRELASHTKLLDALVEAFPDAVLGVDSDERIRFTNSAAHCLIPAGPEQDSLIGRPITDVLPMRVPRVSAGSWSTTDAPRRSLEFRRAEFPRAAQAVDAVAVYIVSDVTERDANQTLMRQKDEQLHMAQRMEALGRMAGGLAHDFNNLLTVIMGNLRMALDELEEASAVARFERYVQNAFSAAEKSSQFTRQLLALSRSEQLRPVRIRVDQLISDNMGILCGFLPESVEFDVRLSGQSQSVTIDRTRLEQIVYNLVLNGRDAMNGQGRLVLATGVIHAEEPFATVGATLEAGSYVEIRISDTGSGMADAVLPHIFEPFYTTKGEQRAGSGFGLATTYAAVRESGGGIHVTSSVGRGSVFAVYLPLNVQDSRDVEPTDAVPDEAVAGLHVLVVEAEPLIRQNVAEHLERHGCIVHVANSVGDGLIAAEHLERCDIVLSDLSSPYLSPAGILERYGRHAPHMKVGFLVADRDHAAPKAPTLLKPFAASDLIPFIRAIAVE